MERLNQRLLHPAFDVGAHYDRWIAVGGGAGLEAALANPAAIVDTIAAAGLAGMGGAGFPTHRKWRAAAAQAGDVKYVVVNGNEDEPGTFKDGRLLARTPHQVIEGALIAALATGATHVVFYVNPRLADALAALREAVGQWRDSPLLARLAAALGHPVALALAQSSGRYIGGEETAIVSTLEGRFPFPRRKPPFPAESGIGGAPTLINNTETIANVPHILREGPNAYRALGIGDACGTKLYSLSGDVLRPGLYELPMGTALGDLVFVHGGGMLGGKALKAVFTGGPSNTLLTAADLDVARYFDFFAAGSCGQCPPCKCGTFQMARLLHRIDTGAASRRDVAALQSL